MEAIGGAAQKLLDGVRVVLFHITYLLCMCSVFHVIPNLPLIADPSTCMLVVVRGSEHTIYDLSLTHHTPQSQGKKDLMTMCTTSCTGDKIFVSNQIQRYC